MNGNLHVQQPSAWECAHEEREWGTHPEVHLVRWSRRNSIGAGSHVLDLGCGAGASSGFLLDEGCGVTALDSSLSALMRLRSRLYPHPRLKMIQSRAICVPRDDGHFDAVVDVMCIAHNTMDDARLIVAEVSRVIKDGGRLFSLLPTNLFSAELLGQYGSYHTYYPDEVRALFVEFDIEMEHSSYTDRGHKIDQWIVSAVRKARRGEMK
jgi:ubiquinone/menaquinone biosynthesis C-methylase UbiE